MGDSVPKHAGPISWTFFGGEVQCADIGAETLLAVAKREIGTRLKRRSIRISANPFGAQVVREPEVQSLSVVRGNMLAAGINLAANQITAGAE